MVHYVAAALIILATGLPAQKNEILNTAKLYGIYSVLNHIINYYKSVDSN